MLKKTIGFYFQGRKKADIKLLKKAFAKKAQLFFVKQPSAKEGNRAGKKENTKGDQVIGDQIIAIPLSAYLKKVQSDGPKQVQTEILQKDITKSMAFVKTRFRYKNATYMDYLTLLKKDGKWKIISKTFVKLK